MTMFLPTCHADCTMHILLYPMYYVTCTNKMYYMHCNVQILFNWNNLCKVFFCPMCFCEMYFLINVIFYKILFVQSTFLFQNVVYFCNLLLAKRFFFSKDFLQNDFCVKCLLHYKIKICTDGRKNKVTLSQLELLVTAKKISVSTLSSIDFCQFNAMIYNKLWYEQTY